MINQNLKILHTAFLYCTGLGSSNITRNSVDTAGYASCILSDQYTDNSTCCCFMVVRAGTEQEETESSDNEAVCRILIFWFIMKI